MQRSMLTKTVRTDGSLGDLHVTADRGGENQGSGMTNANAKYGAQDLPSRKKLLTNLPQTVNRASQYPVQIGRPFCGFAFCVFIHGYFLVIKKNAYDSETPV